MSLKSGVSLTDQVDHARGWDLRHNVPRGEGVAATPSNLSTKLPLNHP